MFVSIHSHFLPSFLPIFPFIFSSFSSFSPHFPPKKIKEEWIVTRHTAVGRISIDGGTCFFPSILIFPLISPHFFSFFPILLIFSSFFPSKNQRGMDRHQTYRGGSYLYRRRNMFVSLHLQPSLTGHPALPEGVPLHHARADAHFGRGVPLRYRDRSLFVGSQSTPWSHCFG
jgi:hypothetical protein